MHCVIVGGGVAGFQAAATCRAIRPDQAVTLIDAENEIGYYRTLLPQFIVGSLPEERLFFWRNSDDPLLTVKSGVRVRKLDRSGRRLLLSDGEEITYDRLILAHGGEPYLPGILTGPPAKGIFPIRDLTTARATKAWLVDHRNVIVFGGSLVGVKMAVHLCEAGFEVSLVVRRGHILLRALSTGAAELVEAHLKKRGIRLHVNAPLEELRIEQKTFAGLKAGGKWLAADTLLVATGTIPDTAFMEGTGLLTDGELIVSPSLQTADPRIFAAGDVAVIDTADGRKISPNTWPQAVAEGRLAAENCYRDVPVPLRDLTRINAMELHGLPMVVLGPPVPGAEVLSYARPKAGVRRELFLIGGRAVGGALIGDISAAGPIHALINAGEQIEPEDAALLMPKARNVIHFPDQAGRRRALVISSKRSLL
jgi:NADPH-dependent 2,4-dienoyl-CoA reductase/sulfur reductase-like enzyme